MPRLVPLFAAVALATTSACDDGRKGPPPSSPAGLDGAVAAPAYQHRPGPAYLGVTGVGLLRLDGGTLTRIITHRYPFRRIVVDDAGVVYATAIGGLWRIEGSRISRLDDDDGGLSLETLALGPDGVLWTSDRREVGRWDGTWTREPAETFGTLLQDLAVDLDGRVWVVSHQDLWRLDGDHWSQLDPAFTGSDRPPFFGALAVDVTGAVHVSYMGGSSLLRDGSWIDTGMGDLARSIDDLVAGPAGHVAGSGGLDTVVVRSPDGTLRRTELSEAARVRRGDVRAVDGAGRVWISTDHGLLVLDQHGDVAQHWLPGTVAGVSGAVTAVAVVADGPSLPALRPAVTGAITGRLRRGGKPVAGVEVQLCDLPMYTFQRTPCELSTFSRLATSAADGGFRLDGVPPGTYGFAIKPDRAWHVVLELDRELACCDALEDGGVHDVGVITVR